MLDQNEMKSQEPQKSKFEAKKQTRQCNQRHKNLNDTKKAKQNKRSTKSKWNGKYQTGM